MALPELQRYAGERAAEATERSHGCLQGSSAEEEVPVAQSLRSSGYRRHAAERLEAREES